MYAYIYEVPAIVYIFRGVNYSGTRSIRRETSVWLLHES